MCPSFWGARRGVRGLAPRGAGGLSVWREVAGVRALQTYIFGRGGDQLSASGGRVSEEQRSAGRPTASPCCAVTWRKAEGALWGPL